MRVLKEFSDTACLLHLRDDDSQAFDMLFDQYAPELCRFADRYLKNRMNAEDAVQECFLTLWERRHTVMDGTVFKAYLYTLAYHAVLKQLRRQRYWVFEDYNGEKLIEETGPSLVIEYQELEQFYQAAVAQLPPRRQQIFALNRMEGLSNIEIAKQLDISVKCVENQMTQALKFLKLHFKKHGMSLILALLIIQF